MGDKKVDNQGDGVFGSNENQDEVFVDKGQPMARYYLTTGDSTDEITIYYESDTVTTADNFGQCKQIPIYSHDFDKMNDDDYVTIRSFSGSIQYNKPQLFNKFHKMKRDEYVAVSAGQRLYYQEKSVDSSNAKVTIKLLDSDKEMYAKKKFTINGDTLYIPYDGYVLFEEDMLSYQKNEIVLQSKACYAKQCNNNKDDEGDGLTDNDDPGCWENPTDSLTYNPYLDNEGKATSQCQDLIDNDGDGMPDLTDLGCLDWADNDESDKTSQCQDGIDNDDDGVTDFPNDFSCQSRFDNDETSLLSQCQDGIDNDGDGLADNRDPGCADNQDNDESDKTSQCQDGIDNDLDGAIDLLDPGCKNKIDNDESDGPVVCSTDSDCGSEDISYYCRSGYYVTEIQSYSCVNAGTDVSYCKEDVDYESSMCNNICSDTLGCDYTECSDSVDNDMDYFVDYGQDLGCSSYEDDDESDGYIECYVDTDCGSSEELSYCDGKNYVTEQKSFTCSNPGTEQSSCLENNDKSEEYCEYSCSAVLGCYVSECKDGKDNDNDGYIDYPDDLSCQTPDDNSEKGPSTLDAEYCDGKDNDNDGKIDERNEIKIAEYMNKEYVDSQGEVYEERTFVYKVVPGKRVFMHTKGADKYWVDDEIILSTKLGTYSKAFDFSCLWIKEESTPIEVTDLFLNGGESEPVDVKVTVMYKDVCGGLKGHTSIYLYQEGCDYEKPECMDGEDNDHDGSIDYPDDTGCESVTDDDESDGPIECYTDIECGIIESSGVCEGDDYEVTTKTPVCLNAGTEQSSCSTETSEESFMCNFICSDTLGCDYTQCSDSLDNDDDTFVDYPNDLGCEDYLDDLERDGHVECNTDLECGAVETITYCESDDYMTETTTPICLNAGTEQSTCTTDTITSGDECNYLCSNTLGCDYTQCSDSIDNDMDTFVDYPNDLGCEDYLDDLEGDGHVECYEDLECGENSQESFCSENDYVTITIDTTCENAGTEMSYCQGGDVTVTEDCSYICSGDFGCDYTECSDDLDNDIDGRIDLLDYGCADYYDDDESDEVIACVTNLDCGDGRYYGELYCKSGDVHQWYESFECRNSGTPQSFCQPIYSVRLLETCVYSCEYGSCVSRMSRSAKEDLYITGLSVTVSASLQASLASTSMVIFCLSTSSPSSYSTSTIAS